MTNRERVLALLRSEPIGLAVGPVGHPFAPPPNDLGLQHVGVDMEINGAVYVPPTRAEQVGVRILGAEVVVERDLHVDVLGCPLDSRRFPPCDLL